jgi:hypothetical protein
VKRVANAVSAVVAFFAVLWGGSYALYLMPEGMWPKCPGLCTITILLIATGIWAGTAIDQLRTQEA